MKISDLLDLIEDDSVPIREKNIIASERIMEAAMTKIHAEEDNYPVRKGMRRGTALVILAAVLLAFSVTAFATGLIDRIVRWDGSQVEEPSATPMPTAIPEAFPLEEAENQAISEALAENRGRDLVIARFGEKGGCPDRIEILSSADQLKALIEEKDSPLIIPLSIPEGYAFSRGFVTYELGAGFSYELTSSETQDNGLVIERYDAPEEGDFISGYTLVFANAAGDELAVYGTLAENSESATFGYMDGDTVKPLDMEGMDDALVIEYPEYTALFMRKALGRPISYVFPLAMLREEEDPVNAFDGIIYEITSTACDGDTILSLPVF
ncbi:MAG: hypothetical protein IJT62_00380 [Oscillospiraceae bacterium]|nr:hypothetical protein [Oscillospiraceae bacterium]